MSYDRIFVVHLVPDNWRPGWSGLQLRERFAIETRADHANKGEAPQYTLGIVCVQCLACDYGIWDYLS